MEDPLQILTQQLELTHISDPHDSDCLIRSIEDDGIRTSEEKIKKTGINTYDLVTDYENNSPTRRRKAVSGQSHDSGYEERLPIIDVKDIDEFCQNVEFSPQSDSTYNSSYIADACSNTPSPGDPRDNDYYGQNDPAPLMPCMDPEDMYRCSRSFSAHPTAASQQPTNFISSYSFGQQPTLGSKNLQSSVMPGRNALPYQTMPMQNTFSPSYHFSAASPTHPISGSTPTVNGNLPHTGGSLMYSGPPSGYQASMAPTLVNGGFVSGSSPSYLVSGSSPSYPVSGSTPTLNGGHINLQMSYQQPLPYSDAPPMSGNLHRLSQGISQPMQSTLLVKNTTNKRNADQLNNARASQATAVDRNAPPASNPPVRRGRGRPPNSTKPRKDGPPRAIVPNVKQKPNPAYRAMEERIAQWSDNDLVGVDAFQHTHLIVAAMKGDVNLQQAIAVNYLKRGHLHSHRLIDATDERGRTMLFINVENKNMAGVEFSLTVTSNILKQGSAINSSFYTTPFHHAAQYVDTNGVNIFKKLLTDVIRKPNRNEVFQTMDSLNRTCMSYLIHLISIEKNEAVSAQLKANLQRLLENGDHPLYPIYNGKTALDMAAASPQADYLLRLFVNRLREQNNLHRIINRNNLGPSSRETLADIVQNNYHLSDEVRGNLLSFLMANDIYSSVKQVSPTCDLDDICVSSLFIPDDDFFDFLL